MGKIGRVTLCYGDDLEQTIRDLADKINEIVGVINQHNLPEPPTNKEKKT